METQYEKLLSILLDPEVKSLLICAGDSPLAERTNGTNPVPGFEALPSDECAELLYDLLDRSQHEKFSTAKSIEVEREIPPVGRVKISAGIYDTQLSIELRSVTRATELRAAVTVASSIARCPVCRDVCYLGIGTDLACPRCAALHHSDCWTYNGGCGVYACNAHAHGVDHSKSGTQGARAADGSTVKPVPPSVFQPFRAESAFPFIVALILAKFCVVTSLENHAVSGSAVLAVVFAIGAFWALRGSSSAVGGVAYDRAANVDIGKPTATRSTLGATAQFLIGLGLLGASLCNLRVHQAEIIAMCFGQYPQLVNHLVAAGQARSVVYYWGLLNGSLFLGACGVWLIATGWKRLGEAE